MARSAKRTKTKKLFLSKAKAELTNAQIVTPKKTKPISKVANPPKAVKPLAIFNMFNLLWIFYRDFLEENYYKYSFTILLNPKIKINCFYILCSLKLKES